MELIVAGSGEDVVKWDRGSFLEFYIIRERGHALLVEHKKTHPSLQGVIHSRSMYCGQDGCHPPGVY